MRVYVGVVWVLCGLRGCRCRLPRRSSIPTRIIRHWITYIHPAITSPHRLGKCLREYKP